MFVTMPSWHPVNAAAAASAGRGDKEKSAKNPVSHWKVSKRGLVGKHVNNVFRTTANTYGVYLTDFVFSPDVKFVAAISEDGCLRVIDALAEQ